METTLRIATFNVLFSHGTVGNAAWAERSVLARRAVEHMRPDVLAMQEVFPSMLDDVRAMVLPLALAVGPPGGRPRWFDASLPVALTLEALRTGKLPSQRYQDIRGSERMRVGELLPIAYRADRLRPLEDGGFWISATPDVPGTMLPLAPSPFLVHWVRFERLDAPGRVLVLNAHYGHAPWHHAVTARVTSDQIARLAPADDGETSVFLVGDFNAWTSSPLVSRLTSPAGAGLVNAAQAAPERIGPRATFHWGRGATPFDLTLDHVLVRTSLRVRRTEVIDVHDGERYPSDHYPLLVEFGD